jgi:hypothetical protein
MKPSEKEFIAFRKEPRHAVPELYRKYIDLKVETTQTFEDVVLLDFSRGGILFESRTPFEPESAAACLISIRQSLSQNVAFSIRVKSCREQGSVYLIGAQIDAVGNETWFNIFMEVHDFIVQRQGIY